MRRRGIRMRRVRMGMRKRRRTEEAEEEENEKEEEKKYKTKTYIKSYKRLCLITCLYPSFTKVIPTIIILHHISSKYFSFDAIYSRIGPKSLGQISPI